MIAKATKADTNPENAEEITQIKDVQDCHIESDHVNNSSPTNNPVHEAMGHFEAPDITQQNIIEPGPNIDSDTSIRTRSKSCIHKTQLPCIGLTETCIDDVEPTNGKESLTRSQWKEAMQNEFQALMSNNTWTLMPNQNQENIID